MEELNFVKTGRFTTEEVKGVQTKVYKPKERSKKGVFSLAEVNDDRSFGISIHNSGLEVIDVDDEEQAMRLYIYLHARKYNFIIQKTTRGMHFIFRSNPDFKLKNVSHQYNALGLEIDVRTTAQDGYIIHKYDGEYRKLRHHNHGKYTDITINQFKELSKQLDVVPKKLIPIKASKDTRTKFANLGDGNGRNDLLYAHIGRLLSNSWEMEEIKDVISDINTYIFSEPIEADIESLFKNYENQNIKPAPITVTKKISYNNDTNERKKATLDTMYNYLVDKCTTKTVENILYWYTGKMWTYDEKEIKRYIGALVHAYEPRVTTRDISELYNKLLYLGEAVELHDNAVTFKNCTIDFNTMQKVDTSEIITKTYINSNYEEKQDLQTLLVFENFIRDIMCGDKEYINLMYQILGDILEPKRTNQNIIFFTGESGGNGKTTFTNLLSRAFGTNNTTSRAIKNYADPNNNFALFGMENALLNIDDDTTSDFIKPGVVKKITGNGLIAVEGKNRDVGDVKINATLLHNTNKIPNLGGEGGISRRVLIIPFEREFNIDEQINFEENIEAILESEKMSEVIISIAVAELKKGKKFIIPERSKELYTAYDEVNKPEVSFLKELHENWEVYDTTEWLQRYGLEPIKESDFLWGLNDTYESFKVWCRASGNTHIPKQIDFKKAILKTNMITIERLTSNTDSPNLKKGNTYYKWTKELSKDQ